jgi:hypothetical protein
MKSVSTAAFATIALGLILVFVIPGNKDTPQVDPKLAAKVKLANFTKGRNKTAGLKAAVKGAGSPAQGVKAAPGEPTRSARSILEDLLKKHSQGAFKERDFEGDLAYHLHRNHQNTAEAVELFLEQRDPKVAHAMARGIAGTLVGDAKARQRILDILAAPPSEMIAETALYTLLTSHHHEDVQKTLVMLFGSESRSDKVKTTAAFVIREGLSTMQAKHRERARHQARYVLSQSYASGPSKSSSALRVECLAILGGHLQPSADDKVTLKAALNQATDRDELEVSLAMLIRHQTPKKELIESLDKRVASAQSAEERSMFQELKRKTLAALRPTGKSSGSRSNSQ